MVRENLHAGQQLLMFKRKDHSFSKSPVWDGKH